MVRPIDWSKVFELRPDLEPPGYHAAIKQSAQYQAEKAKQKQEAKAAGRKSRKG